MDKTNIRWIWVQKYSQLIHTISIDTPTNGLPVYKKKDFKN